jgi:hypothetical protein
MIGGAGFPGTGQMGGTPMSMPPIGHPTMGMLHQGGGGGGPGGAVRGMPAPGFYQGGGGMPSGAEMLQAAAVAGNPMANMALMQQQQMMMMNGHGHHHGHGSAGYPSMGYG